MKFITLLGVLFLGIFASAQTTLICVSWMDQQTQINEIALSEYEAGMILYDQGDWAYSADVMEGKLNYLTIEFKPLKLFTTSRSLEYPLNHLSNAVEISGRQATVDCDLR